MDQDGRSLEAGVESNVGRRVAANALHNAAGRTWLIAVNLLLTAYTVARLGTELFAVWALMIAFLSYGNALQLGGGNPFARFVALHETRGRDGELGAVVSGAIVFYAGGGIILAALTWLAEPLLTPLLVGDTGHGEDFRFVLRVTIVGYVAQQVAASARAVILGLQRVATMRRIWMGTSLYQLAVSVVALESGGGIRAFAIAHTSFVILLAAVSWRKSLQLVRLPVGLRHVRLSLLREMVAFAARVQVVSLATLVHTQLDKVLLAATTGLQWTAFYELGQKAARGFQTLPLMLTDVVMPAVPEVDERAGRHQLRRLYAVGLRTMTMITVPMVGLVAVCAPGIITAWVGPGYGWAAVSLSVIVIVYGSNAMTGLTTAIGRGIGRPEIEMRARLGMAIAHLGLAIPCVKLWGLPGVLLALATSSILSDIFYVRRFHRLLNESASQTGTGHLAGAEPTRGADPVSLRRFLWRPAVATACASLVVLWLRSAGSDWFAPGRAGALITLTVQVAAYAGVLVPALLVTRAVTVEEIRLLWRRVADRRRTANDGATGSATCSAPAELSAPHGDYDADARADESAAAA